jgi:heme A synthase
MTPFSDNALFAMTLVLLAAGLFALLARLRPDLPWPLRLMLTTIGTQGLFLLFVLFGLDQTPPLEAVLVALSDLVGFDWPQTQWF